MNPHPLKPMLKRFLALCIIFSWLHAMPMAYAEYRLPPQPTINAPYYLLMDFNSSHFILKKDIDVPKEIASITKIMTAYAVLKELTYGSVGGEVSISKKAYEFRGSRTFLEYGDKVPLRQVMRGLIIQSGNDAAIALAEHIDGDEASFVARMNSYAKRLELTATNYTNSTGWPDPEHYSTAKDIAKLSQSIIREFPNYYRIFSEKSMTYNGIKQNNRNKLLWYDPSVDGIKTGHTESAKFSLVASAKRDDMRLISVVLGAENDRQRSLDSQKLLNYGFRYFSTKKMIEKGVEVQQPTIWFGEKSNVSAGLNEDWFITIPKSISDDIQIEYHIQANRIEAPIQKGDILGIIVAKNQHDIVAKTALISLEEIKKANVFKQTVDHILYFFHWLWSFAPMG